MLHYFTCYEVNTARHRAKRKFYLLNHILQEDKLIYFNLFYFYGYIWL